MIKWTVGMKIGAGFGLASAIFLIVGVASYRQHHQAYRDGGLGHSHA